MNYCENCGNKIVETNKFCENCGEEIKIVHIGNPSKGNGVWFRLLNVAYIALHLPLLVLIPIVWDVNQPYCGYYAYNCVQDNTASFWYSVISLLVYLSLVRLTKVTYEYVVLGKKPLWGREIKKFY